MTHEFTFTSVHREEDKHGYGFEVEEVRKDGKLDSIEISAGELESIYDESCARVFISRDQAQVVIDALKRLLEGA